MGIWERLDTAYEYVEKRFTGVRESVKDYIAVKIKGERNRRDRYDKTVLECRNLIREADELSREIEEHLEKYGDPWGLSNPHGRIGDFAVG